MDATVSKHDSSRMAIILMWLQGGYFSVFGIWPLIDIQSFKFVTGEKTDHLVTGRESDHWLVMTVGLLVTTVGITLLTGAWRRRPSLELGVLALGSAISLAAIDFIYVARKVILPIYLVDGIIECLFLAMWLGVVTTWWYRHSSAISKNPQ